MWVIILILLILAAIGWAVWALRVLRRPEIREAFRANPARTPSFGWPLLAAWGFLLALPILAVVYATPLGQKTPRQEEALPEKSATVRADLLAVSYHLSEEEAWWNADGRAFTGQRFAGGSDRLKVESDEQVRDFAFIVHGPEGAPFHCDFEPRAKSSRRTPVPGTDIRVVTAVLPKDARSVDIRARVDLKQWVFVAEYEVRTARQTTAPDWKVSFHPPTEADGKTTVVVVHANVDRRHRVVAVDDQGREQAGSEVVVAEDGPGFTRREFVFPRLALRQLRSIRFDGNVYQSFEFKNVALHPVPDAGALSELPAQPVDFSQPPQLRLIAWQSDRLEVVRGWHPDGTPATKEEEAMMARLRPRLKDPAAGRSSNGRQLRTPMLWFSHPGIDGRNFGRIVVESRGTEIEPGAAVSVAPTPDNGGTGWLAVVASPIESSSIDASMSFRFDYSLGPWTTLPGEFRSDQVSRLTEKLDGLAISPGQNAAGQALLWLQTGLIKPGPSSGFSYQDFGKLTVQYDFLAVTKDGREVEYLRRPDSQPGSGVSSATFTFPLPLSEVKFFRVRTRPIQSVQFKDVPLDSAVRWPKTGEPLIAWLQAIKPVWHQGETPDLVVDLRHDSRSTAEVRVREYQLQVDGVRYRRILPPEKPISGAVTWKNADSFDCLSVPLSGTWARGKEGEIPKWGPQTDPPGEPLKLGPGKHTVQVVLDVDQLGAPFEVKSNPVEIEVRAEPAPETSPKSDGTSSLKPPIRARLLAVTRHPSPILQWWKPNGLSEREPTFSREGPVQDLPYYRLGREFVFEIENGGHAPLTVISDPLAKEIAVRSEVPCEGKPNTKRSTLAVAFEKPWEISALPKKANIRLGVQTGWDTVAEFDARSGQWLLAYAELRKLRYEESKDGLRVDAAHQPGVHQWRLVAVLDSGEQVEGVGKHNPVQSNTTYFFAGLRPGRVVRYRIEMESYEWFDFKDVLLWPDGTAADEEKPLEIRTSPVTPPDFAQPPALRFVSWQSEDVETLHGWHFDTTRVTNPKEKDWMARLRPSFMDSPFPRQALRRTAPENRYHLRLWFSHAGFDGKNLCSIEILATRGIRDEDRIRTAIQSYAPDASNGNLGWISCVTSEPFRGGVPKTVSVRMRYAIGPWERVEKDLSRGTFSESPGDLPGRKKLHLIRDEDPDGFTRVVFEEMIDQPGAHVAMWKPAGYANGYCNPDQELNTQWDFLAVTYGGREIESLPLNNREWQGQQALFVFPVSPAQVQSFRVRQRPIKTIVFNDIPVESALGPARENARVRLQPLKQAWIAGEEPLLRLEWVRPPDNANFWIADCQLEIGRERYRWKDGSFFADRSLVKSVVQSGVPIRDLWNTGWTPGSPLNFCLFPLSARWARAAGGGIPPWEGEFPAGEPPKLAIGKHTVRAIVDLRNRGGGNVELASEAVEIEIREPEPSKPAVVRTFNPEDWGPAYRPGMERGPSEPELAQAFAIAEAFMAKQPRAANYAKRACGGNAAAVQFALLSDPSGSKRIEVKILPSTNECSFGRELNFPPY